MNGISGVNRMRLFEHGVIVRSTDTSVGRALERGNGGKTLLPVGPKTLAIVRTDDNRLTPLELARSFWKGTTAKDRAIPASESAVFEFGYLEIRCSSPFHPLFFLGNPLKLSFYMSSDSGINPNTDLWVSARRETSHYRVIAGGQNSGLLAELTGVNLTQNDQKAVASTSLPDVIKKIADAFSAFIPSVELAQKLVANSLFISAMERADLKNFPVQGDRDRNEIWSTNCGRVNKGSSCGLVLLQHIKT